MKIALIDSGRGLLYLLNELIIKNIKHEYHLFFSSKCPIGNLPKKDLIEETRILEEKTKDFDFTVVCCNTLSIYFKPRKNLIKILDYNLSYLNKHENIIPIGTTNTINYLGRGYKEFNLARDIEEQKKEKIIKDIKAWPKSKSYILLCTHYIQALETINNIHPNSKIIDLTHLLFQDIASLKKDKQLRIISHK